MNQIKRGPESKYTPSMCQTLTEIASRGGHVAEMMINLGISSKETFYRWQNENPEFKEAYALSKLVSQAYFERVGLHGALGEIPNFNATTYALIMNNKFPDEYKRSGSGSHTEITVNTLNLSPEQIESKIAQKLEKLKSLGVTIEGSTVE
jgi:hypothetical protein